MDVKKIFIVEGQSQYGALSYFNRQIAEGFKMLGIHADIGVPVAADKTGLLRMLSKYDMIFAFNGMSVNDKGIFREIVDMHSIPCWSFMVDHPYYHHTRLQDAVQKQIVSVIDRKHLEYLQTYYPGIQYKLFVPHGGSAAEQSDIGFEKKKYDISFFGSFTESEQYLEEMKEFSISVQELFIKIADDVWNGKERTLEDSVRNNFNAYDLDIIVDEFADTMMELSFLDGYIRNERRGLAIKMALESGYKVHVFGNGWEKLNCKYENNLIIHNSVDYKESLEAMADTKIVLNNMPLFADGSHERIFSTMASGSICLTDSNSYLEENFKYGEDLFYYNWDNIQELPDIIRGILSGHYDVENIINNGRKKVMSKYMWKNRAKDILTYCNSIEFDKK